MWFGESITAELANPITRLSNLVLFIGVFRRVRYMIGQLNCDALPKTQQSVTPLLGLIVVLLYARRVLLLNYFSSGRGKFTFINKPHF